MRFSAHLRRLPYAECHRESNGVLSFALGSIYRRQIEFKSSCYHFLQFLRHSGVKYETIELIFGM